MNKRAVNFIVTILVVWLIIAVFGLVFYFSGREKIRHNKNVRNKIKKE